MSTYEMDNDEWIAWWVAQEQQRRDALDPYDDD
jgi:hypothetical protein